MRENGNIFISIYALSITIVIFRASLFYSGGEASADAVSLPADNSLTKRRKNMKQQTQKNVKKLTTVAMLTALAVGLQFIEIPIPIMPAFIKLDFSDLPELVGAFMFGPLAGVLIALLKNVIHFAVSDSGFIGEISNFVIGAFFAGASGLVYKLLMKKNASVKKGAVCAVIAGAAGALVSGIVAFPLNLYVIYPLYYNVMGMKQEAILAMYQVILPSMKSIAQSIIVFNVPYTIVKNLLSVIITAMIYKPLAAVQKTM